MHPTLVAAAVATSAALSAGIGPTVASAAPPQQASGTAVATFLPTSVREADGNTIMEGTIIVAYSGTLEGTGTGSFHWVIHPDGQSEFRDAGVFVGSVGDCGTGSVPIQGEVDGSLAAYTGRLNTIDEAADPAGVHLDVSFDGSGAFSTYSGTYTCG